jgi:hypothetical protein
LCDYQPRPKIHPAYAKEDGRNMKFRISAVQQVEEFAFAIHTNNYHMGENLYHLSYLNTTLSI